MLPFLGVTVCFKLAAAVSTLFISFLLQRLYTQIGENFSHFVLYIPGADCSKLMPTSVNVSLKF